VHERPPDISDAELAALLRTGWQLGPVDLEHLPVGFGGYHWRVADDAGNRWFVTAQDRAATYSRELMAAMQTAAALAESGLDFVVAPERASGGEAARSLGPRYAVTVFPYHEGTSGQWGDVLTGADLAAVTQMLAVLHRAAPPAGIPVRSLALAERAVLEASVRERGAPWSGGPFAEPARALVAEHAASLTGALARFDRLAETVRGDGRPLVVTHGEVHPGNLLRTEGRLLLVDWDSVGLAPPERDLWWVGEAAATYTSLSGLPVSQDALELYRLRWVLDDIGEFLAEFRAPHRRTADTEVCWEGLRRWMESLAADSVGGQ
jgi:spectinomycin phosphotransferase